MCQVELETVLFQELASLLGFLNTLGGEVDIMPSSEPVLKVPCGLAVTDEDDFVEGGCSTHC